MFSIEISYVLTVAMLVILFLVNGTIQYHQELRHFTEVHAEEEIRTHTEGEKKGYFQPEKFMRECTVLEELKDFADQGSEG